MSEAPMQTPDPLADAVLVERRGAVAIVTMNLPKKRNALGNAFAARLARAISELQDEPALRIVVLHGGKHFCAGGDLGGGMDVPSLQMREAMLLGQRSIRALAGGRLTSIAAVEGSAFGAGFSLAMACDFVVADADVRFGAVFNKVGLQPDYGLLWSLPQRIGTAKTREIVLFGEPIDGERAAQLGLVDRFAERGEVLTTALALAERLAALPPATLQTTKAVLSRQPLNLDTMLAWEADTQALLIGTADFREGAQAFVERRAPQFKGQ